MPFIDWFGPLLAAVFFLAFGALKSFGLCRGYVGGRGVPLFRYTCGTCPAWRSRSARVAVPVMLLAVGLLNLALFILAVRC